MNPDALLRDPDMNKALKVPAPAADAERATVRAHGLRVFSFLSPMRCHMNNLL